MSTSPLKNLSLYLGAGIVGLVVVPFDTVLAGN